MGTIAASVALLSCVDRASDSAQGGFSTARTQGVQLDLRVDGHDADLVPITWLGVSPSGTIALVQRQDRNVRFFDSTGALIGTFGHDGEGPGEFRRPLRGGWIGDTLWISDPQLNRITLIGPQLELIGTIIPPTSVTFRAGDRVGDVQFGLTLPYAVFSRDTLLVNANSGPRLFDEPRTPIFRATTTGEVVNEVAWVPVSEEATASIPTERGNMVVRIPFAARPTWSTSPDGRAIALLTHEGEHSFRVQLTSATGERLIDRLFPFEPMSIPAARIDSAIAAATERQSGGRQQLEAALRDGVRKTYPGAERVVVGRDHRVWVGLWPDEAGQKWIGLSHDGAQLDSIVLPPGVALQTADSTSVWATERDEVDLESVVRYRLNIGQWKESP